MTRPRVLLIEDDEDLNKLLRMRLKAEGYEVEWALSGEKGLEQAQRRAPDLVILDVMLPGIDGLEVCRRLRKESQVPVVFLTARAAELDRVLGFKLGGDDYVPKPFSTNELFERMKAVLRRARPEPGVKGPRRAGGIDLDLERREVRVKKRAAKLTPKEFELLRLLLEADGKVLSRGELMKSVWGYDESLGIDVRRVDHHICQLRRHLGSEGGRIVTVSGSGYRIRLD